MKNTVTLFFLFTSLYCLGQKAITGSIILQNNQKDLGLNGHLGDIQLDNNYHSKHFPSFSLAYFNFKQQNKHKLKKGKKFSLRKVTKYNRWNLMGFHAYQPEAAKIPVRDSTGNIKRYQDAEVQLAGGRVGFSKGIQVGKELGNFKLYFEPALTLGWQKASYTPKQSFYFPKEYSSMNATLGSNFALHRYFKSGFIRVAALMPIFRFGIDKRRINNPSWTKRQQESGGFFLDLALIKHTGLEIGGGFNISKKKRFQHTNRYPTPFSVSNCTEASSRRMI